MTADSEVLYIDIVMISEDRLVLRTRLGVVKHPPPFWAIFNVSDYSQLQTPENSRHTVQALSANYYLTLQQRIAFAASKPEPPFRLVLYCIWATFLHVGSSSPNLVQYGVPYALHGPDRSSHRRYNLPDVAKPHTLVQAQEVPI